LALDGLTVTIVDPGVLGFEGDVGLEPPLVLVVVVVFAIPPHAQAMSAKSSGSPCNTENRVEPLNERIALTHLEWFACYTHFRFQQLAPATGQRYSRGPVSAT
jgi:hypothetical protein